jgi:hypothetical protein
MNGYISWVKEATGFPLRANPGRKRIFADRIAFSPMPFSVLAKQKYIQYEAPCS